MPTVFLAPSQFGAGGQFFDSNGNPLSGGMLNTYAAGTTTPTATYTSAAGTVQNGNPIILDAAGRPPNETWLLAAQGYKFVLVDSTSANPVTWDNLYGLNDPASLNGIGSTGATVSGTLIMNAAAINEARAGNVAVASSINLSALAGNYAQLTGSGTVTSITLSAGAERWLVSGTVSAVFQNSTTLVMIGGGSYTPAVGDVLAFRGDSGGVVRNVVISTVSGLPVGGVSTVPVAATKAQQTTATVTNAYVTPGTEQFHPSSAKFWVGYSSAAVIRSSYNVASVTKNGTGNFTVNYQTNFTTTAYVVFAIANTAQAGSTATTFVAQSIPTAQNVGSCNIVTPRVSDGVQIDITETFVIGFGPQ